MYTDGNVDVLGSCSFTTTGLALADGVLELLASLGIKSRRIEGRAKLNGRVIGPVWDFVFSTCLKVFRLPRKLARVPATRRESVNGRRYIVAAREISSAPVRCIAVASKS